MGVATIREEATIVLKPWRQRHCSPWAWWTQNLVGLHCSLVNQMKIYLILNMNTFVLDIWGLAHCRRCGTHLLVGQHL
jgi:hypothetical protein